MERSRRLHNFTLPRSWGKQRLLRCMNVDPTAHQFYGGVRIHRQSDSDSDSGAMDRHRIEQMKLKLKVHSPAPPPEPNPEDIGLTREKLMLDFKAAVSKMKDAIFTGAEEEEEEPETTPPPPVNAKRGSLDGDETCGGGDEVNASPPPSVRTRTLRLRRDGGEKERPKFSVTLSRSEIEEDFVAMIGRRMPRKPNKRPKILQNQIDSIFPGSWLTEVTPDLYKVNDGDQKTKKSKHKSKLLRFETETQRDEEES